MSKANLSIFAALVGTGLCLVVLFQTRSQTALRRENSALRAQSQQFVRVAAENERLSNALAHVRVAQSGENNQLQELIRLRAELNRLRPNGKSDKAGSASSAAEGPTLELTQLRAEVKRLTEENLELEKLRDELQELRTATANTATEEAAKAEATEEESGPVTLRILRTQGAGFAEKLKQSVGARDDESFMEVFGRFLQSNGIQTNAVAGAVYDERTGRVIVRGSESVLDQIERLTRSLDSSP